MLDDAEARRGQRPTKPLAMRRQDGPRLRTLAHMVLDSPALRDCFGAILTGIRLRPSAEPQKLLLVTSTQPHEGKTTIASCLAITASLSGDAVLLVDGDLRQPSIASAAGIGNQAGLGELLEGRAASADTIYAVELFEDWPGRGSLSVMAAGGNSAECLPAVDWPRANAAFRGIAQRFSLVLIDSPPILAANDALLLAGIVDGVILAVDAESSDRLEVRRAKERLASVGTPVLGAVLNRFNPRIHGRDARPYSIYNRDADR